MKSLLVTEFKLKEIEMNIDCPTGTFKVDIDDLRDYIKTCEKDALIEIEADPDLEDDGLNDRDYIYGKLALTLIDKLTLATTMDKGGIE